MKAIFSFLLAAAAVLAAPAHATDLARTPLSVHGSVAPNVIFGLDDSGSMDLEILLRTNEGLFWWHNANRTGVASGGTFLDNPNGLSSSAHTAYGFLFPTGCTNAASGGGGRRVCDASAVYAAPPTPQFAALRSADYNPSYYDPATTYRPWEPGTVSGTPMTFSDSNPRAARSHPLFSAPTLDLAATQSGTDSNWTFRAMRGMVVPAGSRIYASGSWRNVTSDIIIGSGTYTGAGYEVSIPYYPAAYWHKETCAVNGSTCVNAPDLGTLRLYEIRTGGTFPSGRTYAAELQNFANWFTYSRKRKLMLSSSMGKVLGGLSGMRIGLSEFNVKSSANVTMYDTDSSDPRANAQVVTGMVYRNLSLGGTPTRNMLKYIGDQYADNNSIITASCQRNAAFMVTDGFANYTSVTPPAYDSSVYGSGAPYSTTHAGSLADIALSYYTRRLRTDLPAGRVPAASSDNQNPAADRNRNLHMNTYGITLGVEGRLWPAITDAYAQPISWVNPTSSGMPESIDDLWHATINGRGKMFISTTPAETAERIQEALTDILRQSGAQGNVTFSTVNLRAEDATAYVGSYNGRGWSGDVQAVPVNPATGVLGTTAIWSADTRLTAKNWNSRAIASYNGAAGVAFTAFNIGSRIDTGGLTTAANAVAYFRGNRTLETDTLRQRTGLVGPILNAQPVVDPEASLVYAATSTGMLHAFDKATGEERWAYVPGFVLPTLGEQLSKTWSFQTMLDATPVLAEIGGRRLLVGGRGAAGAGVYALDVTNARSVTTDAQAAAQVRWEFPNAGTPLAVRNLMGATVGKPLVVETSRGPVVVVASGYFPNSGSTGDGRARLFILNAMTGALLDTIAAPLVAGDSGEAGLAAISGFLEADGSVRYVYGGDERGHLWRFDLDARSTLRLMTLTDRSGVALPITAAPELARISNRRMVFVGTGRFLGESDFNDPRRHSFFGLWDDDSTISGRARLAERSITVRADGRRDVSGDPVDWSTQRGWVVELPQGEKANTDPALASGVVAFTTNSPSQSLCAATSALYLADARTGLRLDRSAFSGGDAFFGTDLGNTLTTDPVLTRLTSNQLGVTTRQFDGTDETRTLNVGAAPTPQKTSWREVLR